MSPLRSETAAPLPLNGSSPEKKSLKNQFPTCVECDNGVNKTNLAVSDGRIVPAKRKQNFLQFRDHIAIHIHEMHIVWQGPAKIDFYLQVKLRGYNMKDLWW